MKLTIEIEINDDFLDEICEEYSEVYGITDEGAIQKIREKVVEIIVGVIQDESADEATEYVVLPELRRKLGSKFAKQYENQE